MEIRNETLKKWRNKKWEILISCRALVQTPSTKFRRRSQLPLRPETHDDSNEKELEDFNGSIRRSPLVKKYYKYFY